MRIDEQSAGAGLGLPVFPGQWRKEGLVERARASCEAKGEGIGGDRRAGRYLRSRCPRRRYVHDGRTGRGGVERGAVIRGRDRIAENFPIKEAGDLARSVPV